MFFSVIQLFLGKLKTICGLTVEQQDPLAHYRPLQDEADDRPASSGEFLTQSKIIITLNGL